MKLPTDLIPEKNFEINPEEIKEIINKTLVEKVLVEDLGKQVKECLENKQLSIC